VAKFCNSDRNVNYDVTKYPDRWENFVHLHKVKSWSFSEAITENGILWLDGGWVQKMTKEEILKEITSPDYKFIHVQNRDIRMDKLLAKARQKQPGLIVVRSCQCKERTRITLLLKNHVPGKALLSMGIMY